MMKMLGLLIIFGVISGVSSIPSSRLSEKALPHQWLFDTGAGRLRKSGNCNTTWNTQQIYTNEPRFVRQVRNAKLYLLDKVNPPIRVLHLWGTPYQRGFAQGQILQKELYQFIPSILDYAGELALEYVFPNKSVPKELVKKVTVEIFMAGLELTYEGTKHFTPEYFTEELRGLADGSGLDLHLLTMINQLPELLKASCAFMGAWGDAIANGEPGSTLYQLRALDWAIDGPFNDFPLVTIYHPHPDGPRGAHAFMLYGYPGFVGTVTGFSSAKVGLSEKLSEADRWKGTTSRIGVPFHYLFRDILEFDSDIAAAMTRIYNAQRTVAVWIGLGDNTTNQFRAVAYGHDYAYLLSDKTYPSDSGSPFVPHVIYNGISDGPSGQSCFYENIKNFYGRIGPSEIINITAADGTGQTQVAIYDFARDYIYLAHTSSNKSPPIRIASVRPFCRLDMAKMWAEPPPMFKEEKSSEESSEEIPLPYL